jgi:hypothetical protein
MPSIRRGALSPWVGERPMCGARSSHGCPQATPDAGAGAPRRMWWRFTRLGGGWDARPDEDKDHG